MGGDNTTGNALRFGAAEIAEPMLASDAQVVVFGTVVLDRNRYAVRVAGKAVALTRLEYDLLDFLARHSNRVVSQAELLENVVGRCAGECGSLIRVHVTHLRRKLGPASTMIQTVRGRGFLLSVVSCSASDNNDG